MRSAADATTATCDYDDTEWVQWRQGDPAWTGNVAVGDEGGCRGFQSAGPGGLGFWSDILFDKACLDGYGPSTQADWLTVVQYQGELANVAAPASPLLYDSTALPYSAIIAASGQAQIDLLNTTLYCRVPWSSTAPGHFCGGYGSVEATTTTSTANITTFNTPKTTPQTITPMCTSIIVDGVAMAGTFVGEQLYAYASADGSSGVNTVFGTTYFWAGGGAPVAGVPTLCAPATPGPVTPLACDFTVTTAGGTQTHAVTCANPAFFNPTSHVDAYGTNLLVVRPTGLWSLVVT